MNSIRIGFLRTRLTPIYLAPATPPIHNRFPDVAIEYDKQGRLAIGYLQRLIALDLKLSPSFFPLPLPCGCTDTQLLQLSVFLPGRDPESGLPDEPLVLSNSQFILLRTYIGQELGWLERQNVSRLRDVEPTLMKTCLQAFLDAANKKRTRILTWSELCKLSTPPLSDGCSSTPIGYIMAWLCRLCWWR